MKSRNVLLRLTAVRIDGGDGKSARSNNGTVNTVFGNDPWAKCAHESTKTRQKKSSRELLASIEQVICTNWKCRQFSFMFELLIGLV